MKHKHSGWRAKWAQAFQPRQAVASLWRPRTGADAGLDGIRALSVLAIAWHHAVYQYLGMGLISSPPAPTTHFLFGIAVPFQSGVDAFFVLSGFLITRQLLEEHRRSGTLSLKDFYVRRAFRILPIYFVMLLVFLPVWPKPANIIFNFLMINNFLPIPEQVLPWSWSLAVEEQFYFVFPWVLLPVLALGHRARALVLGAAALLLGAWAFWLASRAGLHLPYPEALSTRSAFVNSDVYVGSLYLRTDFRGGAIIIGACMAAVESFAAGRFTRLRLALGVLGLGVLIAFHTMPGLMGFTPTDNPLLIAAWYSGRHFGFALAVAAVMFSLRGDGWLSRALNALLGHRFFSGVARLTFALYLVHPLGLGIAYLFQPDVFVWSDFLFLSAVGMVLSVVISVALYALVENPFMRLRDVRVMKPDVAPAVRLENSEGLVPVPRAQ